MKLRRVYLLLAVIGLALPYSQFIPWIMEHRPPNMGPFIHDLFANRISAFFAMDVIVSAVVLFIFIKAEARKAGVTLRGCQLSEPCSSAFRLDCRSFFTCDKFNLIERLPKPEIGRDR